MKNKELENTLDTIKFGTIMFLVCITFYLIYFNFIYKDISF